MYSSTTPASGHHVLKRLLVAFITSAMLFGLSINTAGSAEAMTKTASSKVLKVASELKGTPYKWGGTSKRGFDCSGFTQYVFNKALHKKIPRTAGAQMKYKHISKSKKKKGDLIVFTSGGYAYHVGIYAGAGKIWHSPRPGQKVKKEKIWTSGYVVRRVK